MANPFSSINKYAKCESDVSMVEQGYLLSLIAVVCFASVALLGTAFNTKIAMISVICIAAVALIGSTIQAKFGTNHTVPKLATGETGAAMLEYGYLISLISVVCFAAVALIATSFNLKLAMLLVISIALIALIGTTLHTKYGVLHKTPPIESIPTTKF